MCPERTPRKNGAPDTIRTCDLCLRRAGVSHRYSLPRQRFVSRLPPDRNREDAEQSKAGHHARGHAEITAEGRNQEPGDQRSKARDDATGAIAERDRGGAHVRWKKLRQVNGVARENAPYEVAEDKEEVRVDGIAVDHKIEVEPDCQRADIVEGNRRAASDRVGDKTKTRVAQDAADAPELHARGHAASRIGTGNALTLEHQALDGRKPDQAGPDREQCTETKEQADDCVEAQFAAEQLQRCELQEFAVLWGGRVTCRAGRGPARLDGLEWLRLHHATAEQEQQKRRRDTRKEDVAPTERRELAVD